MVTVAFFAQSNLAWGADGNSRSEHRFGLYFSILGDPFPSLWGINLAYNLASFMRIDAGYGSVSATFPDALSAPTITLTSIAGGAKFFIPGWSFSPVAGINYTNVNVSVTGNLGSNTVYGISGSTSFLYSNFGFDWQTHYGLDIGFGYNLPFKAGVGGLPYVTLGWFF